MTKPSNLENPHEVEEAVRSLFHSSKPDPIFLQNLERQLLERASAETGSPARKWWLPNIFNLAGRAMAWGAIGLILVFALAWSINNLIPSTLTGSPGTAPTALTQEAPADTISLTLASKPAPVPDEAVYFVLRMTTSPFTNQLVRVDADCILTGSQCDMTVIDGYPQTEYAALSWAPDGKLAALYDSSTSRLLTFDPRKATWKVIAEDLFVTNRLIAWSPDGTRVAVTAQGKLSTSSQINIIRVDGSEKSIVALNEFGRDLPLGWLDANTLLVLHDVVAQTGQRNSQDDPANKPGLFTLDITNDRWTLLSQDATWLINFPAVSPDGKNIAVSSIVDGRLELTRVNRDGLQAAPLGAPGKDPTWSPDGQWITSVVNDQDGTYRLYIVRPDGSDLRQVITTQSYPTIVWADNSDHLLLQILSEEEATLVNWLLISLSGEHVQKIVVEDQGSTYELFGPTWPVGVKK